MHTDSIQKHKKIAMTIGVFDCLHEGHVELFKLMRAAGEKTIVLLHDDVSTFGNKGRFTVQPFEQRANNLLLSGLVDEVFLVEKSDPTDTFNEVIEKLKVMGINPTDIMYMRGNDWEQFPGREAVEASGVDIRFKDYYKGVSTTDIRKEIHVANEENKDPGMIKIECLECHIPVLVSAGGLVAKGVNKCFCSFGCQDKYEAKQ